MQNIETCRICGSPELFTFLDLGKQPFANALIIDKNSEEKYYPLSVDFCKDCYLVQLNQTAEPQELFSHYLWVTGTSGKAHEWAEIFSNEALSRIEHDFLKNYYILEIASNDGTFLKPFKNKGYEVLGIDPAENIVEMARAQGIETECQFFSTSYSEKLIDSKGKAGIVFARNVLPHVANTRDFTKALANSLHENGLLIVEVHYVGNILPELQYDSIYHEHLCYFSLKSFERLLSYENLYMWDIIKSPMSGGSLTVYISKKPKQKSHALQIAQDQEDKSKLNNLVSWKEFGGKVQTHKKKFVDMLIGLKKEGKNIAGYGSSARSSTLLNYCNIGQETIFGIADQNPLKHNHFTAGTHIPIKSPEEIVISKPDYFVILAWNFADEIIYNLKELYHFRGKFILPLPISPVVI